jgi:hypothetical protein
VGGTAETRDTVLIVTAVFTVVFEVVYPYLLLSYRFMWFCTLCSHMSMTFNTVLLLLLLLLQSNL